MIQILLFLVFFLYPQDLAEDPQSPVPEVHGEVSSPAPKPIKDVRHIRLANQGLPFFDRERFLREFQKQARKDLMACLRSAPSVQQELSFQARLSKDGKLKEIRLLQDWTGDKDCLTQALSEMRFENFLDGQQGDVEISWRFEF